MSELVLRDITVRYGSGRRGMTAVDGVSLTVPDGEVVGLVGESGSGKSSLARAAVGLVPIDGGEILLDGRPVTAPGRRARRRRRPVQMVFQDPSSSLDPRMTVAETVAEALPAEIPRERRRDEVSRLLEVVHLDPRRAANRPGQLSGGQCQRVALARALAARPEVVIADEITSALDVSIQGAVLNLVRELQRDLGLSMLFISHNLAVVRYVASHVAVMYLGRVVEFGPTAAVLADPQHPYTRDLLAAVPGSTSDRGDPPQDVAEPADPHHPPPGCRYHPRCPIGPLVHPDREICRTVDPHDAHVHAAACHFADPVPDPASPAPEPQISTAHHPRSTT